MAIARSPVPAVQPGELTPMARAPNPAEMTDRIGKRTGHEFSSTGYLMRALTHSSADSATGGNYERLEFLGDRVLGLVIAEMLWAEFPDADEGELSRRFNLLVNADACARIADKINLGDLIATGVEIRSLEGRKRRNIRADAIESLIAAIYLDGGIEPARRFIERNWRPLASTSDADRRDAKTELQEWAHRAAGQTPVYETEDRTGPDHDPVFTVRATVTGYKPETGAGRSKREAEQAAAAAILVREGVWPVEATDK